MNIHRFSFRVLILLVAVLIAGCAVTVKQETKRADLAIVPTSVFYIWSSSEKVARNALPALGAAMAGTKFEDYWMNFESERMAFGQALERSIVPKVANSFAKAAYVIQTSSLQEAQSQMRSQDNAAAVVVIFPEKVFSYCKPGCYAFGIRANYYAPGTRKIIWTALIEAPPKAMHSDAFDSIATDFLKLLTQRLVEQKLLQIN